MTGRRWRFSRRTAMATTELAPPASAAGSLWRGPGFVPRWGGRGAFARGAPGSAAGASGSVALDAGSSAASALLVLTIVRPLNAQRERPPSGSRNLLADVKAGLRFLFTEPTIRLFTALGAVNGFCGGAVIGLLVVYADLRFGIGAGDSRPGILFAASRAR